MLVLRQNNDESGVMPNCKEIELAQIKTDTKTQSRAGIDPVIVNEYAQAMQAGCQFPALVVFFDGANWWLADGYHRLAAAQQNGAPTIQVEIKHGDLRDAILYSCGANEEHGLRRTALDRRRSMIKLFADLECSRWSNCRIAEICKVNEVSVRRLRKHLSSAVPRIDEEYAKKYGVDLDTLKVACEHIVNQPDELEVRRRGKKYQMNTAKIRTTSAAVVETPVDSKIVISLPQDLCTSPRFNDQSINQEVQDYTPEAIPDRTLTLPDPLPKIIEDAPLQVIEENPGATSTIAEAEAKTLATPEASDERLLDEFREENSKDIELVLATTERIKEIYIKSEILFKGNMIPITGQVERVFVNWQTADGQQGGSWFPLKLLDIVGVKKAG